MLLEQESIAAADLDGGSTDNCGVTSFEASQTTFDCSDVGEVTVTLISNRCSWKRFNM